ncbi:unnamed protein product [Pleuronectes platessa]|uniref:Uncharacterized protein n=1 Tax=Pleuronectes platessa TaxID=8262 RepID=A0A9N7Z319_PLEPL|nr:unnamed protein product [Pleuronectes platessa]
MKELPHIPAERLAPGLMRRITGRPLCKKKRHARHRTTFCRSHPRPLPARRPGSPPGPPQLQGEEPPSASFASLTLQPAVPVWHLSWGLDCTRQTKHPSVELEPPWQVDGFTPWDENHSPPASLEGKHKVNGDRGDNACDSHRSQL